MTRNEKRRVKHGWKVVKTLAGSYYSCFAGHISGLAVKEYSYFRWTRRGHKNGPLAVFAVLDDARRFVVANSRDVLLESWVIRPCLYLAEDSGRLFGVLWFDKHRSSRQLPVGTRMAKAVLLMNEDEDDEADSDD